MRDFLFKAYEKKHDQTNVDERMKYLDVVNGRMTKIKYCITCDIYRPPRTVHCGLCNCCIERLDHHCPWLGTCIGKRNYKYFIIFVTLVAILVVKCTGICIYHAISSTYKDCVVDDESKETICSLSTKQAVSIGLACFSSFCGFFVFWLQGYHYYLLFRNETTNENLKGSYELLGNPFDKGFKDNIRRLFRRDKRNWHPEDEIEHVKKETKPVQKRPQVRNLYKMSVTSQSQISYKPSFVSGHNRTHGNEDN